MNKGIPYLLTALVALTLSAGWAAPVMALFQRAAACLGAGGSVDLLRLRCTPPTGVLGSWEMWTAAVVIALVILPVATSRVRRSRQLRP